MFQKTGCVTENKYQALKMVINLQESNLELLDILKVVCTYVEEKNKRVCV